MQAALVIKTANGYAVVPYATPPETVDLSALQVATEIGDRYSSSNSTVLGVLRDMLNPPSDAGAK